MEHEYLLTGHTNCGAYAPWLPALPLISLPSEVPNRPDAVQQQYDGG